MIHLAHAERGPDIVLTFPWSSAANSFGVPSVVNVAGATRAIRTGELLRVDGDRGTVERTK